MKLSLRDKVIELYKNKKQEAEKFTAQRRLEEQKNHLLKTLEDFFNNRRLFVEYPPVWKPPEEIRDYPEVIIDGMIFTFTPLFTTHELRLSIKVNEDYYRVESLENLGAILSGEGERFKTILRNDICGN